MQAIRITAKQNGFRRCGLAHSNKPVDHPPGTFSDEQLEILKKDPMLKVEEVEVDDVDPEGVKEPVDGPNEEIAFLREQLNQGAVEREDLLNQREELNNLAHRRFDEIQEGKAIIVRLENELSTASQQIADLEAQLKTAAAAPAPKKEGKKDKA